jgi:hypothetical protein
MADVKLIIDPVSDAIAKAVSTVVAAVADAAGAAAGQSTAGAQGTVGGAATEAGQSSQSTVSSAQHKNDVSVPEAMESMNLHALKDVNLVNKALVGQSQSNAKLYDVTATALGLAVLTATHHNGLQQQMASDHRDQNHDRQININETDIAAAATLARLIERLNNPTPPA